MSLVAVVLVVGFFFLVLPLSIGLSSLAYHAPRAAVIEASNARDLEARESYNNRLLAKLKDAGAADMASGLSGFSSTRDPFSNLN